MVASNFGPKHDLGLRLKSLDRMTRQLATRDVLQNATAAADGTTVSDIHAMMIAVAAQSAQVSNIVHANTLTDQAVTTFTVPRGFTTALVTATASAIGFNGTSSAAYLYAGVKVNGAFLNTLDISGSVDVNGSTGVSCTRFIELTGLAVDATITVAADTRVVQAAGPPSTPWPASSGNAVTLTAQVIFLR
jgi:hypothetical protein